MKIGIVGLPNVGKSTLFNSITKAGAECANYPFCTIEPNIGVVAVPDERIDKLAEMYKPQKVTKAVVEFVDIAGLVKGASKGEGLGNKFLSHIREVDAICQVVRCFSEGLISLPYTNKSTYVGGVVALLDATSYVKQSYFTKQTLQAYNVGGVAQTNNGLIDQCYFEGDAKGIRVAGLVVVNAKTLTNSYVSGSLTGITDASKVSGVVSQLPVGGLVEHCFSRASFAGNGTKYAETEAEFRATIEQVGQWFDRWEPTGEFKNSIIVKYGDAYVQASFFGAIKTGWIDCSDEQARGLKDDYAPFKKNAGFDQNLWTFDNDNGQGYPTLTYVVKNPNETL